MCSAVREVTGSGAGDEYPKGEGEQGHSQLPVENIGFRREFIEMALSTCEHGSV